MHLTDWPPYDEAVIDDALEAEMELARTLVSLGRAARADAKLGVRQPLPRAIALLNAGETLREEVAQEIKDELNVKQLEVVESLEGLLSYRVAPNFKALGPRLGKLAPRVKTLLLDVDGGMVKRAFDEQGSFMLDVDGEEVKLEPGDVEIRAEQHEDLTLAQDGPHAIALDLTLDDDLRAEGRAREIIRAVNDRRKANGFALADRITLVLRSTARIVEAATRHSEWIATEVLGTRFEIVEESLEGAPDSMIDGEPLWLDLQRAARRELAAAAEDVAEGTAVFVLVEEPVLARDLVALFPRPERRFVVHRIAQRGEEGVVVEDVGVDTVGSGEIDGLETLRRRRRVTRAVRPPDSPVCSKSVRTSTSLVSASACGEALARATGGSSASSISRSAPVPRRRRVPRRAVARPARPTAGFRRRSARASSPARPCASSTPRGRSRACSPCVRGTRPRNA